MAQAGGALLPNLALHIDRAPQHACRPPHTQRSPPDLLQKVLQATQHVQVGHGAHGDV